MTQGIFFVGPEQEAHSLSETTKNLQHLPTPAKQLFEFGFAGLFLIL